MEINDRVYLLGPEFISGFNNYPSDPDPDGIVRDLKAYGSQALNRDFGKPESGRWWTQSASKLKLPDEVVVLNAVNYLRDQEYPLEIWIHLVVETW